MPYHAGRFIDHVHIKVRDLAAARHFYQAVAAALEIPVTSEGDRHLCIDELWIAEPEPGQMLTSGLHLAFQARSPALVDRFHASALASGGRDNGGPGERSYHPGYYGAFVLDPDGNNIEAVWHGPANRSADSVLITPAVP
ncbi:VOC family protein [Oleisolibacter albus]|uniref:VOC family protein n=1 Tax=Oleisolibacter albus TaxID=2171757 RepID=UPI000DF18BB4|nr:VOC family protein [Oleisolibacter albus]